MCLNSILVKAIMQWLHNASSNVLSVFLSLVNRKKLLIYIYIFYEGKGHKVHTFIIEDELSKGELILVHLVKHVFGPKLQMN